LIFPQNIGSRLSIDETFLSHGELYTVVTNKDAHGKKGTIVAILKGTKSENIIPPDSKDLTKITQESSGNNT